MLGAIIGDIAGSRFEWDNHRSKEFELLTPECFATDDSIMSLAVACAVLECGGTTEGLADAAVRSMQRLGRRYPDAGYGGRFSQWLVMSRPRPYQSYGNGAAMRVSACGFAGDSLEEALALARCVTAVTHDHPEGLKGAAAATAAIWLARRGESREAIRAHIRRHYYPLGFTLDAIRDTYRFDESCQNTVPQAIEAFLESTGFEDAIRNAVSIGGDSDTLAAITGGIAEAFYGIPAALRRRALGYLDDCQKKILLGFEEKWPARAAD